MTHRARRIASLVASTSVAISLASCASYTGESLPRTAAVSATRPVSTQAAVAADDAPATQPSLESPFMVPEASLPEGFPAVGPIGKIVLKKYPAYRAARATAAEVGSSDSEMFRALFDHIKKNDIKMTAPVEMTYGADGEAPVDMAFLYRQPTVGRPGADGDVEVVDLPPVTVLSVALRGSYSPENVKEALARLRGHLEHDAPHLEAAGAPRLLGYNSPFVPPFLRMAEVQLPVREKP